MMTVMNVKYLQNAEAVIADVYILSVCTRWSNISAGQTDKKAYQS